MEQVEFNCASEVGEDIGVYRVSDVEGVNEDMIVVVCYMTVEGVNAGENKTKYEILGELMMLFSNDRVMILGDMNGHTGILDEAINNNGNLLMEFAENYDLEILNHTISQGRVTWKERLSESAIDYVIVNHRR